jgi:uncharacterized protein (TIGR02268 family)
VPYLAYRLSLLTLLLTGVAAAQQQSPPPLLRQKSVTLPASNQDAVVRVARGYVTTLTFDSALAPRGVLLQGRDTHFERVDEDERLVAFKPKVKLAPGERLLLTVRFADGAAPQEATFELVAAGEEADASVEVLRRARTTDALETALASTQAQLAALRDRCGEGGAAGAYLAGVLGTGDVLSANFSAEVSSAHSSGLTVMNGIGFRATTWGLVVVHLRSAPTGRPWAPGEAHLISKSGRPVKVKSFRMDKPRLSPGEEGSVLVETEAPWWTVDEDLRLELRDGGGQVSLSGIRL